ncbi:lipopolysaccharide biosynthesis protein [Bacillus sp. Marseille-P3800]|uniref:lipopolysaccharide biosynthesis protein n=1 Tax=Bacillus sp. Marseille-P3800 TaxID=2014782 RepID=UPI000C07F0BE|nr:hypothetical protein [Bacillus sp. Marseille-P3800]
MKNRFRTIYSLFSRVFSAGFSYISLVSLALIMDSNSFGVYNFFITLIVFSAFLVSFGMESSLIFNKTNSKINNVRLIKLVIIQCGISYLFYIFLITVFSSVIFSPVNFNITTTHYILLFSIVLAQLLQNLMRVVNQSEKRYYSAFTGEFIVRPLTLVLSILVLYLNRVDITVEEALFVYFISICLSVFFSAVISLKRIYPFFQSLCSSDSKLDFKESIKSTKKSFRYLGIQFLNQAPSFFLVYFVGIFTSNEKIGIFRTLLQTATLVGFLFRAIEGVYNTLLRESYLVGIQEFKTIVKKQRLLSSIITAVAVFVVSLVSPFLVMFLGFDNNYVYLLILLLLTQYFNAFLGSNDFVIITMGFEKSVLKAAFIQSSVALVFGFILTAYYGIYGSGIAFGLSILAYRITCQLYLKKYWRINV